MINPVRWIYRAITPTTQRNQAVESSMLVLPLIVTGIIYIVKYSIALAFALAGIFAGVRYRTTLKNLGDAIFIFGSMSVGLAAGTRSLGVAFVIAVFFSYTVIFHPPTIFNKPDTDSDNRKK